MATPWKKPCLRMLKVPQLHGFFERIDVLGCWEGARADFPGVFRHRLVDRRPEVGVALDEFGNPGREPQHVLEHQDLAVAGRARHAPYGGNRDLLGEAGGGGPPPRPPDPPNRAPPPQTRGAPPQAAPAR